ncbi:MAG: protein kinase, partial [Planctomycetota bacterium]
MENKPDPLKPNPQNFEGRLFEGVKKPPLPFQAPFPYKLTDSNPNAPVPKQIDMRPTENISAEDLARELEALKKKAGQPAKAFDPRSTEQKFPSTSGNLPPVELATMDISKDQLKKALNEEINDGQVKQILEKFQKGKAFLPFLQKGPASPSSTTEIPDEKASSPSKTPFEEEGYRPTETISKAELQRVLQEKITTEEVQKLLDLGKKQLESADIQGSFSSAPPPPPAYGSSFAPPPPPPSGTFKTPSFIPPPPPPSGTFKVTPVSNLGSPAMNASSPSPKMPSTGFNFSSAVPASSAMYSANPNPISSTSPKPPTTSVNTSGQTFFSQNLSSNKTFSSLAGAAPITSKYDYSSDQQIEEIPPNYRIYEYFLAKKPLGSGGTAYVFEAFVDGGRNQPAGIIKLARKGLGKLLLHEIDFAKQCISKELVHDHLVKYLKTGVTPTGLPFVLSEKLISFPHKELSFEDALAVISKIADVVYYLHKHHLYHRDLKPENILYAVEGKKAVPKIFDFG